MSLLHQFRPSFSCAGRRSPADSSASCPCVRHRQRKQGRSLWILKALAPSSTETFEIVPAVDPTVPSVTAAASTKKATTPDVVTVYFRKEGTSTTAKPGEDFLEVASRCAADIPTGCMHGSCGVCEVELFKYDGEGREAGSPVMLRACVARVPRGWSRVEVGMLGADQIWGQDGWDT